MVQEDSCPRLRVKYFVLIWFHFLSIIGGAWVPFPSCRMVAVSFRVLSRESVTRPISCAVAVAPTAMAAKTRKKLAFI